MCEPATIPRVPPDDPDARTDTVSSRPVQAAVTTTATSGGVLVAVTLRNDTAVDVQVRVDNDLDGPVLPPRREGVPAVGWDEDGFTGTIPANSRIGIGYACPCPDGSSDGVPKDPVSVDVLGPTGEGDPSARDRVADAVRSLGRATPPADAVPASAPVESDRSDLPTPAATWLDAVETRVRRGERLTDATAEEAAAVLEDCGGVDGATGLPDELDGDIAALRVAGDRIKELLARATAADPKPVVSSLAAAADSEAPADQEGGQSGDRRTNGTGDHGPERKR